MQSALLCPVFSGSSPVAVLAFSCSRKRPRDEPLVTALMALAAQLALFLPRADAEARLRQSEERFRLLVHAVKDYAIFMLDPKGRVLTWNEGAKRIKGYEADEIVGRSLSTFYTPEDRERRHPEEFLHKAEREGRAEEEGWRVRKDGSKFRARVTLTAMRGADGKLQGFAKVTRDLTPA
jgi:PAS domain S-box-containing protein